MREFATVSGCAGFQAQ